jgi:hypothetical protein
MIFELHGTRKRAVTLGWPSIRARMLKSSVLEALLE